LVRNTSSTSTYPEFICVKAQCNGTSSITFTLANNQSTTCTSTGQVRTVTGYTGNLTCPDIAQFCQWYYRACPNSCSSNGYCVNGVCQCHASYTGADCSTLIG
jgi:leishmanolysin